jgi:hypothetical protein
MSIPATDRQSVPRPQNPAWSSGLLASPRAASELCRVAELMVIGWMNDGRVRTERVGGELFVRVDDVANLAGRVQ